MENRENHVTPTEWHLMECLWDIGPCTGREAVDYLTARVGWSRSTTLTLRPMPDGTYQIVSNSIALMGG